MKQFKIEVPGGYEIDQENSNLAEGVIKFKLVAKESRVPESIYDVEGRNYFIDHFGIIERCDESTHNHFSTKERAEAMLALGQLVEIYYAINQNHNRFKYYIEVQSKDKVIDINFWFETEELREEFRSTHKELIETVEKGL